MRAYQHALGKVLDGASTMQAIDKQRNLDRFLERQQRIKQRQDEKRTDATGADEQPVTAQAGDAGEGVSHV